MLVSTMSVWTVVLMGGTVRSGAFFYQCFFCPQVFFCPLCFASQVIAPGVTQLCVASCDSLQVTLSSLNILSSYNGFGLLIKVILTELC